MKLGPRAARRAAWPSTAARIQQWVVLRILAEEPQVSHRELAERMYLSAPTLTHHLDRLEADGLLTRTRDTGDRRVVRVDLTPAGAERLVELEAVADATDAEVRALLSPRRGRHPAPAADHAPRPPPRGPEGGLCT